LIKNPIIVTFVALGLAVAVNIFYFTTGNDLTVVVSRTLFADMLLALSLVPIYQSVLLANAPADLPMIDKMKSGLKPVAMYTFLLAIITFILVKMFGEPLIGARIFELTEALTKAVEEGVITAEQKVQQIELAKQIYSPTSHVLIVLLGNLFIGFISSMLSAALIRK
jgi:capsule polysaccharide modification protein KpsS